jgi:ATP-dependent Clp protease adaptor protein ClpS
MMTVQPDTITREEKEILTEEQIQYPFQLVVWNDEVNTFDWVIESLMEICKHTYEQAEQCAFIIHFNGKYAVKEGDYDTLKPMRDALVDRGLQVTIEKGN